MMWVAAYISCKQQRGRLHMTVKGDCQAWGCLHHHSMLRRPREKGMRTGAILTCQALQGGRA